MNFLQVFFLSTLKNLNDFPNFITTNNQELVSTSLQNVENHERIRYDNFRVYSFKVQNKRQKAGLQSLTNSNENFDLWQSRAGNVHIMVSPKSLSQFKNLTRRGRLQPKVLIPNVQSLIDAEISTQRRQRRQHFNWNRYHTLDEIYNWLHRQLAIYPNVTEHFTIGRSTEGREICGIKISYKADNPGIFIESHIHAREWITSATATWIINELLTSKDIRVRYLAENYDWYIVPVLNVDGFVYSHEKDRLWRKTRSHHSINRNPDCVGVDGNRNYNIHWLQNGGASSNPCNDTYTGPYPFSEPEIRGLANYLRSIKNKINILLSFHSYGQHLLTPFGYTTARKPDNFADMLQVAGAFSDTVANLTYHTKYDVGTTADTLYLASGVTIDWAYEQGIRLCYTIEFRDQGQYGFLLPSADIIPNSKETLAGLFALIIEADNLGYMHLKYKSLPQQRRFNVFSLLRLP